MTKSELRQIIKEEIQNQKLASSMSPESLFPRWKKGELSVGNDSVYGIKNINDLDRETLNVFNKYVSLVNKYPKLNKDKLAVINSIGIYGGTGDEFDDDKAINGELFRKILTDDYDYDFNR